MIVVRKAKSSRDTHEDADADDAETLQNLHHVKNTSPDTEFVSSKVTKIFKPPPRYHIQNIKDASMANTDDTNPSMLHSAKNTSSRHRFGAF
jgi:hypothetical protein